MLETTIAGSLPKPDWLAEPNRLWPAWRQQGEALADAKRDATLLWLKLQQDAGIDIVTRWRAIAPAFRARLSGVRRRHRFRPQVEMGIRADRYKAMVPTVTGPIALRGRAHATEARLARAHTKQRLKFTLPGPMTIVDTIADAHYGDSATLAMALRRGAERGGARAGGRRRGRDPVR